MLHEVFLMNFSEKIKFIRGTLLLSQKRLAEELGVSFATVNRWESGKHQPSFIDLKKVEEFCRQNNINFTSMEVTI